MACDKISMSSFLRSPRLTPKCSSSWLFIILNVRQLTSSDPAMSFSTCRNPYRFVRQNNTRNQKNNNQKNVAPSYVEADGYSCTALIHRLTYTRGIGWYSFKYRCVLLV